jgi:hypothetical protein
MDWPFTLEGQSATESGAQPALNFETVSPDYFAAMGIPVRRGGPSRDTDTEGQPGWSWSANLARRAWWPGQEALGQRMKVPCRGRRTTASG